MVNKEKFTYTLGSNIEIGDVVLTELGWEIVIKKTETGIKTKAGSFIEFGAVIFGWKKGGKDVHQ